MREFSTLRDNIYNPAYYRSILNKPFSVSIKYFFGLVLWMALAYTAVASLFVVPGFISSLQSAGKTAEQVWPARLEVSIKNGVASSNFREPVFIPMPNASGSIFNDLKLKNPVANLLVIDTQSEFSAAQFKQYNTLFLLKKDMVVSSDQNGGLRLQSFDRNSNALVSHSMIAKMLDTFNRSIGWMAPLAVLALYIISAVALTSQLLPLFVLALFVWLVLIIAKREVKYLKVYQICLHGMTVAFVLNFIFFIFMPSAIFSFMPFYLIAFLMILFNLFKYSKIEAEIIKNSPGPDDRPKV